MSVITRLSAVVGVVLLNLVAVPGLLLGQVPSISAVTPRAAQPGVEMDVKINGGNLAGATGLWTSFSAEATLPGDIKDNGKNAGEVTYRVKLPANAPVGVHALRITTDKGVSAPFLFLVDDLKSVAANQANKKPGEAQQLTLPVAVDGYVDSLSRHYFKFHVEQGQTVSFDLLARRIGSPLDPLIRLLDSQGREIAYSDDAAGLMGDSRLCHVFDNAGEYYLEIRDISYAGGGGHRYRLRMGDFPCVTTPYPMAAKAGTTATIEFAGPHLLGAQPVEVAIPTDPDVHWINVAAKSPGGQSSGFTTLAVSHSEEALEKEPNEAQEQATRVELGASLNGRFDKPGDVDRFVLKATKGQRFLFTGITRRQGAPTDLYMRLLKADGGQVAVAEDSGKNDALINYTFPEDGDYTLVVEDLHRRGGTEYAYRITAAPYQAGFDLSVSGETLNVPAGGTTFVTLTATRRDYNGPIEITGENLPEGVTVTPTVIGPGRPNAVVTILNAGTAAGKISEIKLIGTAKIGDVDYRAEATATAAQRGLFSNMTWPPLTLENNLALASTTAPNFFTLMTDTDTLVLGKDLKATVKVKAKRTQDFAEAIAIAVNPAKGGLPPEVAVAAKPVEKGKDEVEIVVSATGKAALGDYTIVLQGTGKKDKASSSQSAPGIRISLRVPYTLSAGEMTLERGKSSKLKVVASRNPAYTGPIALTFTDLPKGITAAAATIPEGKNEVEVELTAAADAAVGVVDKVTAKGEGTIGKVKYPGQSPAFKLTVK